MRAPSRTHKFEYLFKLSPLGSYLLLVFFLPGSLLFQGWKGREKGIRIEYEGNKLRERAMT